MPEIVTAIGLPGLSSNINSRIVAMALLFVACPDVYSGCAGVAINGVQFASPVVKSFPSKSPFMIADCGRQKLYVYFASQQAMLASATARYTRAKVRAVCERSGLCAARSEEHTSELQSQSNLVCRLLLEQKISRFARV